LKLSCFKILALFFRRKALFLFFVLSYSSFLFALLMFLYFPFCYFKSCCILLFIVRQLAGPSRTWR